MPFQTQRTTFQVERMRLASQVLYDIIQQFKNEDEDGDLRNAVLLKFRTCALKVSSQVGKNCRKFRPFGPGSFPSVPLIIFQLHYIL
jgi:hypothetical protein